MRTIIQNKKCCFICQKEDILEDHHVLFGKNRKNSEKYGLKVWLCQEHHRGNLSPHFNIIIDRRLKQIAQAEFERSHTRKEFMDVFGRNYLDN